MKNPLAFRQRVTEQNKIPANKPEKTFPADKPLGLNGISFKDGFSIISDDTKYTVTVDKNGNPSLSKKEFKIGEWLKGLNELPVIGIIFRLISFLILTRIIFAIIGLNLIIAIATISFGVDIAVNSVDISFDLGTGINILIFSLIILNLLSKVSAYKFHSVEHMTIDCLERGKEPTFDNIKSSSWFSPYCGSTLSIYIYFIVFALSKPLGIIINYYSKPTVLNVILLTLAYTLFMIFTLLLALVTRKVMDRSKFMLNIYRVIQRLFCWKPNDKQIEAGAALGKYVAEQLNINHR